MEFLNMLILSGIHKSPDTTTMQRTNKMADNMKQQTEGIKY